MCMTFMYYTHCNTLQCTATHCNTLHHVFMRMTCMYYTRADPHIHTYDLCILHLWRYFSTSTAFVTWRIYACDMIVSNDSYFHMYDVYISHMCRSTYSYVWHLYITHMQIPMFICVCGMIVWDDSIFTTRHTYIIHVQIPMFTCMTFMMYTHKQVVLLLDVDFVSTCLLVPPWTFILEKCLFWSWKASLSTWKETWKVSLFISCVWWDTHETQKTCVAFHVMFLPLLMNHEYEHTS